MSCKEGPYDSSLRRFCLTTVHVYCINSCVFEHTYTYYYIFDVLKGTVVEFLALEVHGQKHQGQKPRWTKKNADKSPGGQNPKDKSPGGQNSKDKSHSVNIKRI